MRPQQKTMSPKLKARSDRPRSESARRSRLVADPRGLHQKSSSHLARNSWLRLPSYRCPRVPHTISLPTPNCPSQSVAGVGWADRAYVGVGRRRTSGDLPVRSLGAATEEVRDYLIVIARGMAIARKSKTIRSSKFHRFIVVPPHTSGLNRADYLGCYSTARIFDPGRNLDSGLNATPLWLWLPLGWGPLAVSPPPWGPGW
jgi:hypothetical protein